MKLILIGCGGHFKVINEIIKKISNIEIIGVYDDNKNKNELINEIQILGKINDIIDEETDIYYFCSIGDNKIRKKIFNMFHNLKWAKIVSPDAIISKDTNIGIGTLICAGVVIEPNTQIGNFSIINTNSSINHDCIIGNFCHICPGVTVCGNVIIKNNVFVGAGTTIINRININNDVIIGAGSLLIKSINKTNITVYGRPVKM